MQVNGCARLIDSHLCELPIAADDERKIVHLLDHHRFLLKPPLGRLAGHGPRYRKINKFPVI